LILFTLTTYYIYRSYVSYRRSIARVPELVNFTLDKLREQARVARMEDGQEGWISIGQLRDDVLRDEHSVSRREKIWKRVRAVVEMNANVRARMAEGRSGEVSRVWEWIGAVGGYDGRLTPGVSEGWSARREKRVSFSPPGHTEERGYDDDGIKRELAEVDKRKWEESRPIF
jgi:hypothetical protein